MKEKKSLNYEENAIYDGKKKASNHKKTKGNFFISHGKICVI
jgi:hypothetical protein